MSPVLEGVFGIALGLIAVLSALHGAPEGYEDRDGFHLKAKPILIRASLNWFQRGKLRAKSLAHSVPNFHAPKMH
jgi:hypothetical protein